MARAVDVYRLAVIKATFDEFEELLVAQQKELMRRKGSWRMRALGVQDAIDLLRIVRKKVTEEKSDATRTAEEANGSKD
jgi:hypothetical protein